MNLSEAVELVDAITRFAYNAEFAEFKEIYGVGTVNTSEQYLGDKYHLMQDHLAAFFGMLDGVHQRRLVRIAVERYNEKQGRSLQLYED